MRCLKACGQGGILALQLRHLHETWISREEHRQADRSITGYSDELTLWKTMILDRTPMVTCSPRNETRRWIAQTSGCVLSNRSWRPSVWNGLHSRSFGAQTPACHANLRSTTRSPLTSAGTVLAPVWKSILSEVEQMCEAVAKLESEVVKTAVQVMSGKKTE